MVRELPRHGQTERRGRGGRAFCGSHGGGESVEACCRTVVGGSWTGMWLDLRPVIGNVLNDILLASGAWWVSGRETFVEFSIAGVDDAERCRESGTKRCGESGWWLKCATLRLGLVRVAES